MGLCQNALNEIARDVRQPVVAACVAVRELFVIDAQQVQDCGLEIVDMDWILGNVEAKIIGRSMSVTGFDAATGQPYTKSLRMMVATV